MLPSLTQWRASLSSSHSPGFYLSSLLYSTFLLPFYPPLSCPNQEVERERVALETSRLTERKRDDPHPNLLSQMTVSIGVMDVLVLPLVYRCFSGGLSPSLMQWPSLLPWFGHSKMTPVQSHSPSKKWSCYIPNMEEMVPWRDMGSHDL